MVFTKLSDSQKEQLAIFKAEHGTVLTSSTRALVMRGSTTDDAKKMVLSRQTARAQLVEEMEKEAEAHKDLQEQPPLKAPRKPRAANKSKSVVEPAEKKELKSIPEDKDPDYKQIKIIHPKAKAKKEPKAKATKQVDESGDVNILL